MIHTPENKNRPRFSTFCEIIIELSNEMEMFEAQFVSIVNQIQMCLMKVINITRNMMNQEARQKADRQDEVARWTIPCQLMMVALEDRCERMAIWHAVVIGSRCGLQGWRSRGPAASGPAELGYCF
jgi:hypothetical protein